FFFQAEDGIRDLTVTGVQTCALPISLTLRSLVADLHTDVKRCTDKAILFAKASFDISPVAAFQEARREQREYRWLDPCLRREKRSEERRVGKEWRTGRCGEY